MKIIILVFGALAAMALALPVYLDSPQLWPGWRGVVMVGGTAVIGAFGAMILWRIACGGRLR